MYFAKAKTVCTFYLCSTEYKYLLKTTAIIKMDILLDGLLFQGTFKLLHSQPAVVSLFLYPRIFYSFSPIMEDVGFFPQYSE